MDSEQIVSTWQRTSGEAGPVAVCNVAVVGMLATSLCGKPATHRLKLSCHHLHFVDGWACGGHANPLAVTLGGRAVCVQCGRGNPNPADSHPCPITVMDIEAMAEEEK